MVLHLLGQSHTLAWQAAQRTLLELVRTGDADAAVVGGLSGDAEVALRTCAVLAAVGDQQRTSLFAEPLSDLCLAPRLDRRQAAAIALRAIGQQIPADAPTRGLPPGLRFELPQRHDSHAALDPLEQTLGLWRPQLQTLADLSGVDVDAAIRTRATARTTRDGSRGRG